MTTKRTNTTLGEMFYTCGNIRTWVKGATWERICWSNITLVTLKMCFFHTSQATYLPLKDSTEINQETDILRLNLVSFPCSVHIFIQVSKQCLLRLLVLYYLEPSRSNIIFDKQMQIKIFRVPLWQNFDCF